jgi:hypothetical protein
VVYSNVATDLGVAVGEPETNTSNFWTPPPSLKRLKAEKPLDTFFVSILTPSTSISLEMVDSDMITSVWKRII